MRYSIRELCLAFEAAEIRNKKKHPENASSQNQKPEKAETAEASFKKDLRKKLKIIAEEAVEMSQRLRFHQDLDNLLECEVTKSNADEQKLDTVAVEDSFDCSLLDKWDSFLESLDNTDSWD